MTAPVYLVVLAVLASAVAKKLTRDEITKIYKRIMTSGPGWLSQETNPFNLTFERAYFSSPDPGHNAGKRLFYIQNVKSKMVLGLKGGSMEPNAQVVMADKIDSSSQHWIHEENAIMSAHCGLALAVKNLSNPINNPVVVKTWDTGNDKKWMFHSDGRMQAAHWGYVMTSLDDNSVIGTRMALGYRQIYERVYL